LMVLYGAIPLSRSRGEVARFIETGIQNKTVSAKALLAGIQKHLPVFVELNFSDLGACLTEQERWLAQGLREMSRKLFLSIALWAYEYKREEVETVLRVVRNLSIQNHLVSKWREQNDDPVGLFGAHLNHALREVVEILYQNRHDPRHSVVATLRHQCQKAWCPRVVQANFKKALAELTFSGRKEKDILHLMLRDQAFQQLNQGVNSPLSFMNPRQLSLEHIIPQTPTKEAMREAGFKAADLNKDNAWEVVVNSLGNYILLKSEGNSAASNKPFSEKRAMVYSQSGHLPSVARLSKLPQFSRNEAAARTRSQANELHKLFSCPA
jgi:hypothetical protein